jgi:hypothetical protein
LLVALMMGCYLRRLIACADASNVAAIGFRLAQLFPALRESNGVVPSIGELEVALRPILTLPGRPTELRASCDSVAFLLRHFPCPVEIDWCDNVLAPISNCLAGLTARFPGAVTLRSAVDDRGLEVGVFPPEHLGGLHLGEAPGRFAADPAIIPRLSVLLRHASCSLHTLSLIGYWLPWRDSFLMGTEVTMLGNALRHNRTIFNLDLSENDLPMASINLLLRGVTRGNKLQVLNLRFTRMFAANWRLLAQLLKRPGLASLEQLHLWDTAHPSISLEEAGSITSSLGEAIALHPSLTHLDVGRLSAFDAPAITTLLHHFTVK